VIDFFFSTKLFFWSECLLKIINVFFLTRSQHLQQQQAAQIDPQHVAKNAP